jgi:PAS domain S-box-containing protein
MPANKWEPLRPDLGLGRVFDTLSDAVVVAEAGDGRVAYWNDASESLFGYERAEAIGMALEDLMPPRIREMHRAGLARYNRTGHGGYVDTSKPVELPALHRDGHEIDIELTLSPLNEVDLPGRFVMAIVRDITERRHAEEELRQSHTRLQGRLQQEQQRRDDEQR